MVDYKRMDKQMSKEEVEEEQDEKRKAYLEVCYCKT